MSDHHYGRLTNAQYREYRVKKAHEWGVVAQTHKNPGYEFHQCQLCGKICEGGDYKHLMTFKKFLKLVESLKETNPVYLCDSDIPYLEAIK